MDESVCAWRGPGRDRDVSPSGAHPGNRLLPEDTARPGHDRLRETRPFADVAELLAHLRIDMEQARQIVEAQSPGSGRSALVRARNVSDG